jgi:predicted nucleotidyltransferase
MQEIFLSQGSASDPSDISAQAAAVAFAQRAAMSWDSRNDARVLGVYLLGSLAHGGFSRRYSDIDLALVLDAADPATIEAMRRDAGALSFELAGKLSLFWTDRGFSAGRFPLLDRIDYLDHAVALVERERVLPPRPSLDDVRTYLGGPPLSDWAATARRFAALDELDPESSKRYLRALLYPARFIFSWMTGRIASNDDAVALLSQQAPHGLDVALIERALACRRANADPGELFAARDSLPQQVEACEQLVAGLRGH